MNINIDEITIDREGQIIEHKIHNSNGEENKSSFIDTIHTTNEYLIVTVNESYKFYKNMHVRINHSKNFTKILSL